MGNAGQPPSKTELTPRSILILAALVTGVVVVIITLSNRSISRALSIYEVWRDHTRMIGLRVRVQGKPDIIRTMTVQMCCPMTCGCNQTSARLRLVNYNQERYNTTGRPDEISVDLPTCQGDECSLTCTPFDPAVGELFEFVGRLDANYDGDKVTSLYLTEIDVSQSRRMVGGKWEPIVTGEVITPLRTRTPQPNTCEEKTAEDLILEQTMTPSPNCRRVAGERQQACSSSTAGLSYWLYQPEGLLAERLPLIIYLHGFSRSGNQLSLVLQEGIPAEIENGRDLPAVVISPQCPEGQNWQYTVTKRHILELVKEAVAFYPVDPERVILTGFSMGGDGVWAVGLDDPDLFAALAPVGSWYDEMEQICLLKDVPVWVFQGGADEVVNPSFAQQMVAALKACAGNVSLTVLDGARHDESATLTYHNEELYAWMLAQSRK